MANHPKCTTPGCAGDPTVRGTANRQCSRCYQWTRRHPDGPPPSSKPLERTGERVKVSVSLPVPIARKAKRLARDAKRELATWIRGLVERETAKSPQAAHEDCRFCGFPVIHDGAGWVCSGCAPEEDRKRVIRRVARGGGR